MTIFFYGHTRGSYRYMSNFYPCTFTMSHECIGGDGNTVYTYPTSEHAIMHIKARLMGDAAVASRILVAETPHEAKRLGRSVKPWNQELWTATVKAIAVAVLTEKFRQNEDLARMLRETGNEFIAEAAPRDNIWGIGMGIKEASRGGSWTGRNLLGKTLMTVRASLTSQNRRREDR